MAGEKTTGPLSDNELMSELETTYARRTVRVSLRQTAPLWKPPTDVVETEETVIVMVEVAGMHGGDFNVSLHNRQLTITGARRGPARPHAYHQMEIHYGEFRTDVELPAPVQAGTVEADYKDGFLHVVLPKRKHDSIQVSQA